MCGIAGIIRTSGSPDRTRLEQAAHRLSHRGPDNFAVSIEGNVGLVHTRLSIIDLEGGNQPLTSEDGAISVVANGEIYNYLELREAQEKSGIDYRTGSDCESILHVWRQYGPEGLAQLHGMYAAAIHDRVENSLTLVRDRLGIKPLYYAVESEQLVFASEIKALLELMQERRTIHLPALAEYLDNQFSTGKETILDGVYRLLPAERLTVDNKLQVETSNYWDMRTVEPLDVDYNQACEIFDPLFEQVMRQHMRSDVPFGIFLSGGVDSAVVMAMLHRFGADHINSYCVGFHTQNMRHETQGARRIAELFGSRHQEIDLNRGQTLGALPRMAWCVDDLMRDYASLPTLILAHRAGQDLKVVFTGEGGDEVFAGYGRYRKSSLERRLRSLWAPGSGGFRTRGQVGSREIHHLLNADYRAASFDTRRPTQAAWQSCPQHWGPVQRSQFTDITTALPDNLLSKVDRTTMSASLEARVPFLDHRLVEFGLALPDNLKIQSGHGKWFLKQWAERYLPKDYLWGRKTGFNVPVAAWLDDEFRAEIKPRLLENAGIAEYFDKERVAQIVDGRAAGKSNTRALFSLMQFALWYRLFLDGQTCASTPSLRENPLDWLA